MKNLHSNEYVAENFNCLSDEELALKAKTDRKAASAVILRYSRVIYMKARGYCSHYADVDDLCQEGFIALVKAIETYSSTKGTAFSAYAGVCIENRMRSYVTKGRKTVVSLADYSELGDSCDMIVNETPETVFLHKEFITEILSALSRILSDNELKIFRLSIEGMSYRQIAVKLGISEKSVDNAMQRARRKVRTLMRSQAV